MTAQRKLARLRLRLTRSEDALKRSEAATQVLVDAVAFYATPATYLAVAFLFDTPCGIFQYDFEEIEGVGRPGRTAREAIEECRRIYDKEKS